MRVYFPESCPALEERLEKHVLRLKAGLASNPQIKLNVRSVLIGGSYGRGEGGVSLCDDGKEQFFEKIEYYVFCKSPGDESTVAFFLKEKREHGDALSAGADFHLLRRSDLGEVNHSMRFSDLVAGHHAIFGPEDFLADELGSLDQSKIKLEEASRLLWNLGSGVYFAKCRIEEEREARFIQKRHQRCLLGIGDALLCAKGKYHASLLKRLEWLMRGEAGDLPEKFEFLYQKAVRFELRPVFKAMKWGELRRENNEITDLWRRAFLQVESQRLNYEFPNQTRYAGYRGSLFPEVPKWKGVLCAMRDRVRHQACLKPVSDYPRAGLMRALNCLLDREDASTAARRALAFLPRVKEARGVSSSGDLTRPRDLEPIYSYWWQRYS